MKYIIKSIAIFFMVLIATSTHAQDNTINFTLNSPSLQTAGQNIVISSIITKTGKSIIWQQSSDEKTDLTRFTIISTSGNWDQSTSLGSVTYTMVDPEGSESELTLTGIENSSMSVNLTFKLSATELEAYLFNIDTITYQ